MKRPVAQTVSWLLNPGCLVLFTLIIAVVLSGRAVLGWLVALGIFSLIAGAILLIAWARGVVIDADLFTPINLVHRSQILIAFLSLILLLLIVSFRMGQPYPLHATLITFLLLGMAVTVITLLWKISLHMLGVTTLATIVLVLVGPAWWPISLLIPVIAWARLTLQRHTIWQVVAGFSLGLALPILVFYGYGLI
ncbi:hypothetical protein HY523_00785 [Candidatus Berkelbacteria bacterium]|nr:hypothetical protein [Candidatus Berkelbacteria bacterium]